MSTPLSVRVLNVSNFLKIPQEKIFKYLEEEGISEEDGLVILDSPAVSIEDLSKIFERMGVKSLKAKACAGMLKEVSLRPPLENTEERKVLTVVSDLQEVIKVSRPIQQWSDKELLEKFSQERDVSIEQELNNRAKGNNFVVLKPGKYEPGKEQINIELTLDLLKTARKRTNPSMVSCENIVCPVYKITELSLEERILDFCPLCGEILYKGYCEKCGINLSKVGQDERAYMHLISKSNHFNISSFSDRKAVYMSAMKGIEDLQNTWPSVAKEFDTKKALGTLPVLRTIESRPPTTVDPFHVDGNRLFGNRKY